MTRLLRGGVLTLLAIAALHIAGAEEVLFVDWDGEGIDSRQSLATDGATSKVSAEAFNYVFDESISWKPLEGYNPPAEKTADFGLAISSSMGRGPAAPRILHLDKRPAGGTLTVLVEGSEAEPPQMRGLLFFTKSHFLNGAEDSAVQIHFDASSRLEFIGFLDGMAPEARWLVRDGEDWYVSEEVLAPQLAYDVPEQRELANPGATRWAAYNVQDVPLEAVPTQFEKRSFSNITAVGVFWNSYDSPNVLGGTSISRMAVNAFSAQASK